ncbi:MAG: hypothetical protein D6785_04340, partial [Planctomycetota bacterium]
MKIGSIAFGRYLLLAKGAKSHYTEIWKGVKIPDELKEKLKEKEEDILNSSSDEEKTEKLEAFLLESQGEVLPKTLTFFRGVQPEDRDRYLSRYSFLVEKEIPRLLKVEGMEYNEEKKIFLLVTEYIQGIPLNKMISKKGPNGAWGMKVAHYLIHFFHEIHNQGIVHGGIRPDSILFVEETDFKIRGVGILELLGGPMGSRAPRGPGALRFVPKELWEKEKLPNPLSDIYSLGMCLYYLLSGTLPIKGDKP